jgi:3-deoxy-7-phosphoheptulonate synthase
MSPETGTHPGTILEESARIRDALLAVQAQTQAVAHNVQASLLENIRAELGYPASENDYAGELSDRRIIQKTSVVTPEAVATVLPISEQSAETTGRARENIGNILSHEDDRLLVIVGPCSIHEPEEALEYAEKVRDWRSEYGDDLELVMRTYLEKPRTARDWKGFIYDPLHDESNDINLGVVASRMLMCQITHSGVPGGMERLNALTPQYFNGLVAYDAIGARNSEDQKAREYGSGTSAPVGFKHSTDGNKQKAIDAVKAARGPHAFLGMDMNGMLGQINTAGNELGHIILRGSEFGPNYDRDNVKSAKSMLRDSNLPESIVVDASHANSGKVASRQIEVVSDLARQLSVGQTAIRGVMLESYLKSGNQAARRRDKSLRPLHELQYGLSVTDECINPQDTQKALDILAEGVHRRRTIKHLA